MEAVSPYEVRCPRCDVSFPVGTRVCLHCGGRTGPSLAQVEKLSFGEPEESRGPFAEAAWGFPASEAEEAPIPPSREALEKSPARPSPMRALVTLLWVALAIGISIARSCGEG